MSDDENGEDLTIRPGCFWERAGKCFLSEISRERVLAILARNPLARKELLKSEGTCQHITDEYRLYATLGSRSVSQRTQADVMQRRFNQYQDNHRNVDRDTNRGPQNSDDE